MSIVNSMVFNNSNIFRNHLWAWSCQNFYASKMSCNDITKFNQNLTFDITLYINIHFYYSLSNLVAAVPILSCVFSWSARFSRFLNFGTLGLGSANSVFSSRLLSICLRSFLTLSESSSAEWDNESLELNFESGFLDFSADESFRASLSLLINDQKYKKKSKTTHQAIYFGHWTFQQPWYFPV